MDLDFNYKNVNSFEFEKRKELLIIDLADWISPKMNEIHNLNHSAKFWLSVLGQHLSTCINKKHLFEVEKDVPRYLATLNVLGKPSMKQVVLTQAIHFLKPFREYRKGALTLLNKKLRETQSVSMGPRAKELSKQGMGIELEEYYPITLIPKLGPRKKWRKMVAREENLFLRAVLAHLPIMYVEFFHKYYESAIVEPHKKIFHTEHLISLHSNVLIAKYFEKGAKFYYYQGGCGYGEIDFSPRKHVYLTCTKFRTYGWKVNEKDEPFKAFRLETFRQDYNKYCSEHPSLIRENTLIAVGSTGFTPSQIKEATDVLANKVDKAKYKKLMIRLRPFSSFISTVSTAKKMGIDDFIKIDEGLGRPSIIRSTAKSKLTILLPAIPSTHFYECIAINQPILAIDNANVSDIMRPFQLFFHKIGVFHESMDSLVRFMNDIEDVNNWWSLVNSYKEFKEFRQTFCGNVGI